MISGVPTMMAAEALLFRAWPPAAWMAFFFVAPVEEKRLERRFGDDYRLYKANAPRRVPRRTPWTKPWPGSCRLAPARKRDGATRGPHPAPWSLSAPVANLLAAANVARDIGAGNADVGKQMVVQFMERGNRRVLGPPPAERIDDVEHGPYSPNARLPFLSKMGIGEARGNRPDRKAVMRFWHCRHVLAGHPGGVYC